MPFALYVLSINNSEHRTSCLLAYALGYGRTRDLKTHAMAYKGGSGNALIEHLTKHTTHTRVSGICGVVVRIR